MERFEARKLRVLGRLPNTSNFSRLLAASDQHFADMQSTLIVVDRLGRFFTPPARHIAWHNGSALSLKALWCEEMYIVVWF